MNHLIPLLFLFIICIGCQDDEGVVCAGLQSLRFEINVENDLDADTIRVGDVITVDLTNPIVMHSIADMGSLNIQSYDRQSAITFKKYVDSESAMGNQMSAIESFDFQISKGFPGTSVFLQLMPGTHGHTKVIKPVREGDQQLVQLKITPMEVGVYFIFFQDGTDVSNYSDDDADNDGCRDEIGFFHNNRTKNGYSFLEGEILRVDSVDSSFLQRWGSIAFVVEN